MTAAEVLRRAEAAGVAIDEDLLPELVNVMDLALTPLRDVDTRTIRPGRAGGPVRCDRRVS